MIAYLKNDFQEMDLKESLKMNDEGSNDGASPLLNVKQGRVAGKNSKHRSGSHHILKRVAHEIHIVLKEYQDKAALKEKKVGTGTQGKRESIIYGFFSELFGQGYKIESIQSLKQKHLIAVFNYLEAEGQSPSTIQNKISVMRTFCGWIGKNGMVRDSTLYVKERTSVRRSMVVTEDKSWDGNGIDVVAILPEIAKVDQNVALWLELCWAFGLRVKESVMFKPKVSHEGSSDKGEFIWLREGTKGDRPRVVPIENDVQRNVLERAKKLADGKTGFMGKRGMTLKQKRNRFNYVLRKCGITLAENNISAHGLRHQYMQNSFKQMLGIDAPVRGGDLSEVDKDELHLASQKLMERAGHTRVTIGASYYGSRRIPRKEKPLPENDAAAEAVEISKNLSDLNMQEGE